MSRSALTGIVLAAILLGGARGAKAQLILEVIGSDFQTSITNVGTTTIQFDGYEINSGDLNLDPNAEPNLDRNLWISLASRNISGFIEINTVPNDILAELSPIGELTLLPGEAISIGQPFGLAGTTIPALGGGATFGYLELGQTDLTDGEIRLVPEPLTAALAVWLSIAAVFTRHRRMSGI